MILLTIFETTLPLVNPVLKFLLILVIILFAPIILNRIKIPPLLGLIMAGALVGTHGLNLIERDSSIILSGTAGLLYIMFLAGLEIDLADFKKNSSKSLVFGAYTFIIPMVLGTLTGLYVLNFSVNTSVLLASMFASHTLIAYPIISKLGVAKNRAVNIAIGGTLITDILALLVLAIIVGLTNGVVNTQFWVKLTLSFIVFGLVVMFVFPMIGRWFFKRYDDGVSQYVFVLVMVFLGAELAEMAGIEAIIGAFLCGLSLNKLIPHTSPLMSRIEFVGNAIFIPFFLIGVGMLIDYTVFFKDFETLKVAGIMIFVATLAKFLAAWLTQKTFKFSIDERRLIFGLSNAQAAATLAAVLVGYNIIIGETANGEPIRLLNESVLNGTILMILFTCTIASFVAQKGAKNIALSENSADDGSENDIQEKILIPVSNNDSTEELIHLGLMLKSKNKKNNLVALSVVKNEGIHNHGNNEKEARKVLQKASLTAAAADNSLMELLRYDINIVNGIRNVVKENQISDIVLGVHTKKGFTDTFLGKLTESVLNKCNTTTLVYKSTQPLGTIKRHIIVVPNNAENEIGFPFWLLKTWNIARNSGAKLVFYANTDIINYIQEINAKHPLNCEFNAFEDWSNFLDFTKIVTKNDNLVVVMSRKEKTSYHPIMTRIPSILNTHFQKNSYLLIYPMQIGVSDNELINYKNPTFMEPMEKLDEFGKSIAKLFKLK